MTGYSSDAGVAAEIDEGRRPVLQKPFTADALLAAVRSTLHVEVQD